MAKSNKRNQFRLSVIAAALSLSASWVYAAGLGQITVLSPLGQPLRAEIDVNATQDEMAAMGARIASPETFRQVGIEYVPSVSGIRFALDKRKDGQPVLRMTSDRPISEPFLDVLVELTWASGRMVREYTVLLDPPEGLAPSVSTPAPVTVPQASQPAAAQPPVAPPVPTAVRPTAPVPVSAQPRPSTPELNEKAPAPATKAASPDTSASHRVERGDTLSKIASEMKPEGVSLDQMLVALFRQNEDAFDGGNINRLRAGKILTAPTAEAIGAVSPSEARRTVVAHARDFNAYRNKLASTVAAAAPVKEAAKQADQGKIAPKIADKAVLPDANKDKLAVSRTESAKDAKQIQGRITALEEDLVARDRALKEANSRVAQLERNLADLKKLAEIKNQSGAQMQGQAEAAKPDKAVVPEVKTSVEPVAVKPPEPAASIAEPPKVLEPVKSAEAPKEAPAPVEPPMPAATNPDASAPPVEEPGFVDENPLLVYGGGGLMALLLGYFAFSRRRKNGADVPQTASRLSEGDLMASSVFGTTGGQSVDTSASIQTDFSQASLSAIDADEGVDPVAEADVYMAYGRDAQAEEILLEALKADPARLAIYVKLLEIYSSHKNLPQFGKIASDLHAQTGGAGPEWDKAAAMGRTIDPANPLYTAAAMDATGPITEEPELVVPAIDDVPASQPVAVHLEQPAVMDDTVTLPGQLAQLAAAADHPAVGAPNLGFDLDIGSPSAIKEPVASISGLDLDIGAHEVGEIASVADKMDIDLSIPASVAPSAVVESGANDLDFEFDLDAPATVEDAASVRPVKTEPAMDFSGINLDLVTSSPVSVGEPESPSGDSGVDFDGDNADVATKLELAQAYEEMGDREGARELLQEVLQEGSVHQQEIARAKLAALDA